MRAKKNGPIGHLPGCPKSRASWYLSSSVRFARGSGEPRRSHSASDTLPLLTFSPSWTRKVQNDNDEVIVRPPKVKNAWCSATVTAA